MLKMLNLLEKGGKLFIFHDFIIFHLMFCLVQHYLCPGSNILYTVCYSTFLLLVQLYFGSILVFPAFFWCYGKLQTLYLDLFFWYLAFPKFRTMCISKYPSLDLSPTDILEEHLRGKFFVSHIEQATHIVPALSSEILFLYVCLSLPYLYI